MKYKSNAARLYNLMCWVSLSLFLSLQVASAQYPQPMGNYISDFVNVIDSEHAVQITQLFSRLNSETGIEAKVVVINSMHDYLEDSDSIEEFATGLFNQWGIGQREKNNGVLFLVAIQDRKTRIELGSGFRSQGDAFAKNIIDDFIVPEFRQGRYSDGILQGAVELSKSIQNKLEFERQNGLSVENFSTVHFFSRAWQFILSWIGLLISVITAIGVFFLTRRYRRYRTRTCKNCNTKMTMLDENQDDSYLDSGQRIEEGLKSVNYDVWKCPTCSQIKKIPYRAWFSRFKMCPSCGYKSYYVQRTRVVERATTYSTGQKIIYHQCKKCRYKLEQNVTIPRLEESSSSDSSSSSSSSGGSSSGGGASGSW